MAKVVTKDDYKSRHTHSMKNDKDLQLIILPYKDLVRLGLLETTDWQFVSDISSHKHESDIDEELKEIKEFYGLNKELLK